MIDGNAIFDEEGVADLGKNEDDSITLTRHEDKTYSLNVFDGFDQAHFNMTQDELYNLGLALARLADVK